MDNRFWNNNLGSPNPFYSDFIEKHRKRQEEFLREYIHEKEMQDREFHSAMRNSKMKIQYPKNTNIEDITHLCKVTVLS